MGDQSKSQAAAVSGPVVDRQVVAELVARAQADGVAVDGEGGLLAQLTKLVLEASLPGELDAHLGYGKHDPAGRDGGNFRNGTRAKGVLTAAGPVELVVPRDRDGSFEPVLVHKRQRRLGGIDGIVLSLTAKGLSSGEVCAHLAEAGSVQKRDNSGAGLCLGRLRRPARPRPLDSVAGICPY